jgi:deoxycytidylate deaminase
MGEAAEMAKQAMCLRALCGAVIVKDGRIIGAGYNAPPQDDTDSRRCNDEYELPPNNKHDRTCCVHAEWRAIHDALRRNPDKIMGSTLYFTRVNEHKHVLRSGKPYCTECSRMTLDERIRYFVLWHEEGMVRYGAKEYNDLSYKNTKGP